MPNVTTTPATIEVQITAVKSLVSQGMLTPEQGLARMAAIHSSAAGNGNGAKSGAAVPAADTVAGQNFDEAAASLSVRKKLS